MCGFRGQSEANRISEFQHLDGLMGDEHDMGKEYCFEGGFSIDFDPVEDYEGVSADSKFMMVHDVRNQWQSVTAPKNVSL